MSPTLVSLTDEKTFPLNRPSIFIGRDRWRVDVSLGDENVEDVHCELVQHGTGFRLINLSEAGTLVNGQIVNEAVLQDGDELTIASHRLRLTCPSADESGGFADRGDTSYEMAWTRLNTDEGSSEEELTADMSASEESSGLWYVDLAGMTLGPMPLTELSEMIESGQAHRRDRVRSADSDNWQTVAEFLGATDELSISDSSAPSEEHVADEHVPVETNDAVGEEKLASEKDDSAVDAQFFVMLDEVEEGPLPRDAVQQLAFEFRVLAETLVRSERSDEWIPAWEMGIDIPPPPEIPVVEEEPRPETLKEATQQSGTQKAVANVAWGVLAPFYFVANGVRAIVGLPAKTLAIVGVIAIVFSSAGYFYLRGWSQTALSGTVTIDGEPVPNRLITLHGMLTGDTGVGLTDGSGRFTARTLDGQLLPGRYHVTVTLPPGVTADDVSPDEPFIPTKYETIGTTDVVVDITDDSSRCSVTLTSKLSTSMIQTDR